VADPSIEGEITLDGARQLWVAGHAEEAQWVISALHRKIRRSADAVVLRAQISADRGRHKKAKRLWRKALRSLKKQPEIGREYGIYLLSRKQTKKALAQLHKYLKARPNAEDRADIEAIIQSYEGGQ
jgi:Tfp pilus assembly protein PilF